MPSGQSPHRRHIRRLPPPAPRTSWQGAVAFTLTAVALLAAACSVSVYALQRAPSRYIAAYVPEPLQGMFSRPHIELPTPIATLPPQQLGALLTPVPTQAAPTATASPSPSPVIAVSMPTPTNTPTPTLTLTPAYAPGPTQVARSTPSALKDMTILLTGFRHEYQTWNNCGPATLAMALSYFGWSGDQKDTASFLKPDPEDRNVNPEEMTAYVRSQGYQVIVRAGGTLDIIKAMLHAGLPVIIERGFEPEEKLGWMGHYVVIVGYSQPRQEFVTMDSYLGPLQAVSFAETDRYWRHFNRTYLVIYRDDQALMVSQLIGSSINDALMYQNAMAVAQAEVAANPQDAHGWFNIGTNYEAMGMHTEAAAAYDHARQLGLPWRMTWYQFGWLEAYLATGRYDDVEALVNATLKSNPYSEEMYYYKGRVFAARGDLDSARAQYQRALQHNPNFAPAQQSLNSLNP